jgi:AcrR family transcriptional regulator
MEGVASRAGVSKETVYRWWPSKGEVLLEALAELGQRSIPAPDTGTFRNDLSAFMRATARALDPATRRLLRTVAAQAAVSDAFSAQARARFLARRREALSTVLQRAVDRGVLETDRVPVILDLVFGSLWYRLIFGIGPLDRAWADAVTETICETTSPPRSRSARSDEGDAR